ncbi:MAG: hypothetical protein ACOY3P_23605 [Planctomycetota bacterium]
MTRHATLRHPDSRLKNFIGAGRPCSLLEPNRRESRGGQTNLHRQASRFGERSDRGVKLPPYFKDVVDEAQKEAIYTVLEEYKTRADSLQAQLEAFARERDERIDNILRPEQLKQIEKLRTEAKEKAARRKASAASDQPTTTESAEGQ